MHKVFTDFQNDIQILECRLFLERPKLNNLLFLESFWIKYALIFLLKLVIFLIFTTKSVIIFTTCVTKQRYLYNSDQSFPYDFSFLS